MTCPVLSGMFLSVSRRTNALHSIAFRSSQVLKADSHCLPALHFHSPRSFSIALHVTADFAYSSCCTLAISHQASLQATACYMPWVQTRIETFCRRKVPDLPTPHGNRHTFSRSSPISVHSSPDVSAHRMASSIEGIQPCTGTAEIATIFWVFLEEAERKAPQQASYFINPDFRWYIAALPSIVDPAEQFSSHDSDNEEPESGTASQDTPVHSNDFF